MTYAAGSFLEEYSNKIQILQLEQDRGELVVKSTIEHPYPATRLQFAPESLGKEYLATSGDYLRLWTVGADGESKTDGIFSNVSPFSYLAPQTFFSVEAKKFTPNTPPPVPPRSLTRQQTTVLP